MARTSVARETAPPAATEKPPAGKAAATAASGSAPYARLSAGRVALAAALAWLVPGSGHFLLGRWGRGILFLLIIAATLAVGLPLDGRLFEPTAGQPMSYLGTVAEMGLGLPYFILRFAMGYEGNPSAPGYEYGTTFLLTGALMNILLIFDAWDIALGKKA